MTDPAYRGEAILLRWGESSANGRTVTFQIGDGPDDAERHPFYGLKTGKEYGQRFALVAVPLAENENDNLLAPAELVKETLRTVHEKTDFVGAAARPALTEGERLVRQAGILCGDERFQQWAENEVIRKNLTMTGVMVGNLQETAAWFVRWFCGIASRRELATNEAAAEKFRALVARYRQETGQLAEQRG